MINPIHLRTLLETVRLGSFAAAANRLGYTASAVSQQMAALEHEVGVPLFERSARSARPTEAAAAMARHAVRVLADIDALLAAAVQAHSTIAEELRVAVFPSLAKPLLSRLLRRPEWSGDDVDLRIWVGDPSPTIQEIRSGREFDVALVYQVGDSGLSWPQAMGHRMLGDDEFRIVAPAEWGFHPRKKTPLHALTNRPWISHHSGTSDADIIDRLFRAAELRPRTVSQSDEYSVTLELVAAGFGASYVPQLALHQLPDGVVVLDVPELRLARRVYALTPGEQPTGQAGELLDAVAEILAGLGMSPPRG